MAIAHGNKTMFAEQIMDLKDQFKERFQLINIFSREFNDSELMNGRIDAEKLKQLLIMKCLKQTLTMCLPAAQTK